MVVYFGSVLIGVVFFQPLGGIFDRFDTLRLRWIASLRTDSLTDVVLFVNLLASRWTIRALRWGTIAALVGFRHWRHLFVFLGSMLAAELVAYQISVLLGRSRPLGITIIAPWEGYSMPSRPVVGLAASLVGITYALVVPGRPREISKWIVGGLILALVFARLYLAVDHPTDAGFGAIMGVAIPLVAFRWYTPNDVFPVTYRRGKAAHLDVGGRRGQAIKQAIQDQLGFEVLALKPVGLEASGGSSPVRMTVLEGAGERHLFAKLLAKTHVRSDRWYKLGRTILYGGLEDETAFKTVRRIVEYEDHMLRLMRDAGIRIARPFGIVEITPEREYMLVTEFFDGAEEIGNSEIAEGVIDQGLDLVLKMWEAGLAHRDIKPANLMVRDGELLLIDTGFAQVRPSPWRQAIDLANMMLVLALRSDARTVYERALGYFTPEEIAEAFAATHGIASPSQLRAELKGDTRDLFKEFRSLAPARRPIPIQVWSFRRAAVTLGAAFVVLFAILLVVGNASVL